MKDSTHKKLLRIFDGQSPVSGADRAWALSMVGSSQADLAEQLGVTRPTVNGVLHDRQTSANVATKLAEVTGLTIHRLWPDGRYDSLLGPAGRGKAMYGQARPGAANHSKATSQTKQAA